MPYGVGGAVAEGLRSGFEMGRGVTQDAERKREFEIEQAVRQQNADRLWKQEQDRYSRMQDAAQVEAQQAHLAMLDKVAKGYEERGEPVASGVNELRADAMAKLSQMHRSIATTGRLTAPTGVQDAAPTAAPLPDIPQDAAPPPQGGVQGAAAPAPSPPAAGLGPSHDPVGMGVDGLQPGGVNGGQGVNAQPAVASPTASAVTPQQQFVTQTDQNAQDLASRLHTGQASLADVAPKDFALMVASATKHDPSDLSALHQGLQDFHAGMTTGNNGLTIQGLNAIYRPQINQGTGQPSPYGGNIVSQKLVGIDPGHSADGSSHPDRVMLRKEVTTDRTGPDGAPLIYHAPMMGADDKVAAIPMADAFNHIGAQGALAATLAHPDAQALLAKGAKDPEVQKYLDFLTQQAAPHSKADVLRNRMAAYQKKYGTSDEQTHQAFVDSGEIGWQSQIPRGVGGGDVAAAEKLMTDYPGQYKTIGDALNAVRSTTHAYSKNQPGVGGVQGAALAGGDGKGGGGVQGGGGGKGLGVLTPEENDALFGPTGAVTEGRLDAARINSRTAKIFAQGEMHTPGTDYGKLTGDMSLERNATFRQRAMAAETLPAIMQNMVDAGKKLNYSDIKAIGQMQAWVKGQVNDPDMTDYMVQRNDALMGIAGVMRGVGMTDQAHRAETEVSAPTLPPKALDAWLAGQQKALAPRLAQIDKINGPKGSRKGVQGSDTTAATKLSPEDTQALEWAKANPNDPRAAQIKSHLGM